METEVTSNNAFPIDPLLRASRANGNAGTAADTLALKKLEFRLPVNGLRIVAPTARHAASFEEYRRPDARTVMRRKSLYVEYQAGWLHGSPYALKRVAARFVNHITGSPTPMRQSTFANVSK